MLGEFNAAMFVAVGPSPPPAHRRVGRKPLLSLLRPEHDPRPASSYSVPAATSTALDASVTMMLVPLGLGDPGALVGGVR